VNKRALITGVSGQDGSYLAEFLLDRGYEVHGIVRRAALEDSEHRLWRIRPIMDRLILHPGSLDSYAGIFRIMKDVQPHECYHLAAQSSVADSFDDDISTINTNISSTLGVLSTLTEAVSDCRFYFAASSDMFGNATESPQNEETPFRPRSPYGLSKLAGFHLTKNHREVYGLHACSGILFNHESPRRGFEFVTRKITRSVARIKLGTMNELPLGNLDAERDWGFAGDYVRAMWLTLQASEPDDYVIAGGVSHTVRDFAALAFEHVGLNWKNHVVVDERLFRPADIHSLRGDYSKAEHVLGWKPSVSFEQLVIMMVEHDLRIAKGQDGALCTDPY
jgi:GDPmannose 4,6-dehydratase